MENPVQVGVSMGKSRNYLVDFPATHVWFLEGTRDLHTFFWNHLHRPYRCHVALNSMCRADLFARLQELVESSGITKVEKPWDRQRMGGLGETGRCHWPWQHPDHRRVILWVEAFGAFWADFWAQNLASYYRIFIYIYIQPVFLMVCPLVCFSNNMFFCL